MAGGTRQQEIGKYFAGAENALVKALAVEGGDDLLIGRVPIRVFAAGGEQLGEAQVKRDGKGLPGGCGDLGTATAGLQCLVRDA
jgi:hypothetical protein